MKLVDTHCHLDFAQYDRDRAEVMRNALREGVVRTVCPGIDPASSARAVELSRKHPEVYPAVGIHPHYADDVSDSDTRSVRDLALESDKVIAVGEIGLDNYRRNSSPDNQMALFEKLLGCACEMDLPVIIHDREADRELIRVLDRFRRLRPRGVVHCYSGSAELIEYLLEMDMYISFTGTITFDKADDLRRLVPLVPPERLLLETDAPYMAPVPERGKRNEPANVRHLLPVLADIYGLSREDVARITTVNADRLFYLGIRGTGTVVYPIRDVLYVNITHRCSNRCVFCTRNTSTYVKGHDLRLYKDPSTEDIIRSLPDLSAYREVAFCGLGEPLLRLGTLKRTARHIKQKGGRVRVNTNGQAGMIAGRDIAPELKGLVDSVSVSLNACDADYYEGLSRPVLGTGAYEGILDFVRCCVREGIEAEITCLDILGREKISVIRDKAERTGARFRLRRMNVVG